MPETFDPDAWPNPSGGQRPSGGEPARKNRQDPFEDDDYDPLAFDSPADSPRDGDFGDSFGTQTPDLYSDDDLDDFDDDFTTTGRRSDTSTGYPPAANGYGGGDYGYGNDFDNLYDDDEDNYDRPLRPSPTTPGYDDYDDYDDDDAFDREPPRRSGSKLVPILIVIALVGGLGFAGMKFLGSDDNAATDESQDKAGQTQPAPADVVEAVDNALVAWGEFAVDGDLDHVRPYFVNDGPQFDQFLVDAEVIGDKPPGGEPLIFRMENPETYPNGENEWLFKGDVIGTRSGEKAQTFTWELRVIRQSDKEPWRVLSVRQVA